MHKKYPSFVFKRFSGTLIFLITKKTLFLLNSSISYAAVYFALENSSILSFHMVRLYGKRSVLINMIMEHGTHNRWTDIGYETGGRGGQPFYRFDSTQECEFLSYTDLRYRLGFRGTWFKILTLSYINNCHIYEFLGKGSPNLLQVLLLIALM